MSFETYFGLWSTLADRLDSTPALVSWQDREPALRQVQCITGLIDTDRSDAVLGAFIRLAAHDGYADNDALLVAVHLLRPGTLNLVRSMATVHPDVATTVFAQVAVQVRTFPVTRRNRAFAANVLLDTKAAVLRELAPYGSTRHRRIYEISVPTDTLDVVAHGADDDGGDLIDLLVWAEKSGVVDAEEALVLTVLASDDLPTHGNPRAHTAARLGISLSTVHRRIARAVPALAAAKDQYLTA